ncbi:iron-containing redox enzyme family protein [Acinetobacter sp. 18QD2AZ41W]|uniref:iron-containing redox enzyme family protein n=1 Tax=Acinetobacter sp. 18QD2AZ41W TaxID=2692137 RepID=UPI00135BBC63|nr:iron-containing redox enzyme family protein [Acinetobacter sp. 18QD2AZ41W]
MFVSTELSLPLSPNNNHNYQFKSFKDWVDFFQDTEISTNTKTEQAESYLSDLIKKLNIEALEWLDQPAQVEQHLLEQHHQICAKFQAYLGRRKQYQAREYFPTVSHAFEFLSKVAPVKLVDGSWLYSTVHNCNQPKLKDLIYIYLEELGLGHPRANHVTMYQHLLSHYELNSYAEQLDASYYEQAAVQLALAYAPAKYLPLVIGFNLGYEQLPLHLLITNYELAELGIDPHYFNVHITIDNAHNGHAQKSLQAFIQHYDNAEDPETYLDLIKQGYLLNDIGKSSSQIVRELDIERMALKVFQNKALIGQYIHNQKCQFSGKTINDWLSDSAQIFKFLNVLIEKGWIIKDAPVEQSRFWKMIDHPEGKMFGVFNATEKQIIKDWIQGATLATRLSSRSAAPSQAKVEPALSRIDQQRLNQLKNRFMRCEGAEQKIDLLIPYTSPHMHHTEVGLWATRQLGQLLFPFQTQAMHYS